MSWIMFNKILLNLDHVISIDRTGKCIDIYVEGSPSIQSKKIEFSTEDDCKDAFDRISALVSAETSKS